MLHLRELQALRRICVAERDREVVGKLACCQDRISLPSVGHALGAPGGPSEVTSHQCCVCCVAVSPILSCGQACFQSWVFHCSNSRSTYFSRIECDLTFMANAGL